MNKIIQTLRLEAEAIYHVHLKATLVTLGLVALSLILIITRFDFGNQQNNNLLDFNELGIYYDINIGREYSTSESAQQFFATNNQVEQIYDGILNEDQNTFGHSVTFADADTLAVSSINAQDSMVVYILERDNNEQWQKSFSFSYENASTTNYQIPNTEKPTNGDDLQFGASLTFYTNGNTLVVGAPGWQGPAVTDDVNTNINEEDDGSARGAVYIFQKNNNSWTLDHTMRGSEARAQFGSSVNFSPSGTLAIGAMADDPNTDSCPTSPETNADNEDEEIVRSCPAVYIYEKSGGQWSQTTKIADPNENSILENSSFGGSVSFASDNLLAIGAPTRYASTRVSGEGYNRSTGAVYLYAKDSNGDWSQELSFSNFLTNNPGVGKYQIELWHLYRFGHSISFLDANTMVVGSKRVGHLHVFKKDNGVWGEVIDPVLQRIIDSVSKKPVNIAVAGDKLLTGNPTGGGGFAQAIDIHGDIIAVTDPRDGYGRLLDHDLSTGMGVVNLLDWSTFRPDTTWHYTYIDGDDTCGANDFTDPATVNTYIEGDSITPTIDKEGQRLCFKAQNETDGIEYFASDIIDLTLPGFASPSLDIAEDGTLTIYFNERVRRIDDNEIDEDWVINHVSDLSITIDSTVSAVSLMHNNDSPNNNSLISVEHIDDRTVLKLQLDTDDSDFPPASPPTPSSPHTYEISLSQFEDLSDNPQTDMLKASQVITGYVEGRPIIAITLNNDQTLQAEDQLDLGESVWRYVWIAENDTCDSTTSFSPSTSYSEGRAIRLEESHNGQQICFRAARSDNNSMLRYEAQLISDIDRTAPSISIDLTETTLSAEDTDTEATTWQYVIADNNSCNSGTDFASATDYIEGSTINVDRTSSAQANKYYCFSAADAKSNTAYETQFIDGIPTIKRITVNNQNSLFGINQEIVINIYFNESLVITNSQDVYLHLNSQSVASDLNAYSANRSNLSSGRMTFVYTVLEDDYTNDLDVIALVLAGTATIKDNNGNDASLTLPSDGIVDSNDLARTIMIDGLKPVISLNEPGMITWSQTKTVSATDNEASNDSYWDYHFIRADQLPTQDFTNTDLVRACYLGKYLPGNARAGTAYTEGDDVTLNEEHNGSYICFRSRRSQQALWDQTDGEDRAGAVSQLIQNIDQTIPQISLSGQNDQITATDTDTDSGVKANSLKYKIVNTAADCTASTLESGTTTYTGPVAVTAGNENKFYCFGAEDVAGNKARAVTDADGAMLARITAISSTKNNGSYRQGTIDITVTFSRNVTVDLTDGTPYLVLNSDGQADYVRGSGSTVLTFTYTIAAGQNADDLDVTSIILNNGIIEDGNQQAAATSQLPTGAQSLAGAKDIVIDTIAPDITVTSPNTQVSQTKTISAASDSADIDTNSWRWRSYDPDTNSCDQALMARSTTSYSSPDQLTLDKESYNDQRICFSISDIAGNAAYAASETIQGIDRTAPEIDLTVTETNVTVSVSDSDVVSSSLVYKLIASDETCDSDALASDTTTYSDGAVIQVQESDHGSRLCFAAEDTAGNTTYETTRILRAVRRSSRTPSDNTPPNIIISNPDNSVSATIKTVSATSDSSDVDDSTWLWKTYDPDQDNCDATLMAEDTNAYTTGATIELDDESYNSQGICFSVSDDDNNRAYVHSEVINGIDRTAPSVTITINNNELTAVDDDDGTTSWRYQIIEADVECDQSALDNTQTLTYVEGEVIDLSSHDSNKVCFEVQDALGNTDYYDSGVINLIQIANTPPNSIIIPGSTTPGDDDSDPTPTDDITDQNQDDSTETQTDDNQLQKDHNIVSSEEQETGGINPWLLLLSLILVLMIFFIIARRRQDEEDRKRA